MRLRSLEPSIDALISDAMPDRLHVEAADFIQPVLRTPYQTVGGTWHN
jgi:hypothetical protein